MSPVIMSSIRQSIGGNHQRIASTNTQYQDIKFRHLLLPLWISAYQYGGQTYRFLVNARSGEVQGERPYSAWKIAILVMACLAAVVIAVLIFQSSQGR
jgi:hypothetical protein